MGRLGDFMGAVGPTVKKIAGSIKDEVSVAMFNDFVEEMEVEIRKSLCVPADKPIVKPMKAVFQAYLAREAGEEERVTTRDILDEEARDDVLADDAAEIERDIINEEEEGT